MTTTPTPTNTSNNHVAHGQKTHNWDKIDLSEHMRDAELSGIQYPTMHDVLSGRGGHAMAHSGNLKFRALVDSYKPRFQRAYKHERVEIANIILAIWRSQTPMGRFLTKTEPLQEDSLWEDIGNKAALKKISQTLRERRSHTMIAQSSVAPPQRPQPPFLIPATPTQHDHQLGKIRELEEQIERLKMQNFQQQKLREQLIGYHYPQPQVHPSCQQPNASTHLQFPHQPSPPAEPLTIDVQRAPPTPFDQSPSPQSDIYNPAICVFSTRPPLPRRNPIKNKERTNSFVRVFDTGGDHGEGAGDEPNNSGTYSEGQKPMDSSDETTRRMTLMSDSVGSFSVSSSPSPSMDSANRYHMRLNSKNSS